MIHNKSNGQDKAQGKDLRATWSQGLITFLTPIVLLLSVRWLLFEPFVIPSGSMIPTLLIHDHIFVNKLAFGIRIPFAKQFLAQWSRPEKGQVVVFRYPDNPEVFYVKRVLATGGDEISIEHGIVSVNGSPLEQFPILMEDKVNDEEGERFEYLTESFSGSAVRKYAVRYLNRQLSSLNSTRVPEGSFFVVGDNRDQSNDSRFWGFVPDGHAIGTAKMIWLSCEQTLTSAPFICAPQTIRWDRLLKKVE